MTDHYGEDGDGFAEDLHGSLRRVSELLEEAIALAEPLERDAGRPPMTRQEAVADIVDRVRGDRGRG